MSLELKRKILEVNKELSALSKAIEEHKKDKLATELALEVEHEAANRYARQVAHWIEKHDVMQTHRNELLEALKRIVDWDDCGLAMTAEHINQAKEAIRRATNGAS
jgi:hypothetical protein